ncbi:MAG TPA: 2TM domain-containing protein [Acidimicrobiia bacterium]|jgi:hypothetical protein|nr:2TM domain-containing protein [Acidimicrobiia bacterium]
MAREDSSTPEARARKRVNDRSSLLWHISAFVIVNAFLWFIDIAGGGGVQWAYWTTIPWGVGLAFHIAAYLIEERGGGDRRYQQYLEEERRSEANR